MNVTSSESGHWRMTSTNSNSNTTARGISLVDVMGNNEILYELVI